MRSFPALLTAAAIGAAALGLASSPADASGTHHSITAASETNYSPAVERPTWTFSCDSATGAYSFAIDEVQIIDASGTTWNGSEGPWRLTVFDAGQSRSASTASRVLQFELTLGQNGTDGLYTAKKSAKGAGAAAWCSKGTVFSVVGFSHDDEPLLLDGTVR